MINITSEDVADFLKGQIERKPTPYEVEQFEEYAAGDVYEWFRDNYKAWTEHKTNIL